jgi:hypothetical protein
MHASISICIYFHCSGNTYFSIRQHWVLIDNCYTQYSNSLLGQYQWLLEHLSAQNAHRLLYSTVTTQMSESRPPPPSIDVLVDSGKLHYQSALGAHQSLLYTVQKLPTLSEWVPPPPFADVQVDPGTLRYWSAQNANWSLLYTVQ